MRIHVAGCEPRRISGKQSETEKLSTHVLLENTIEFADNNVARRDTLERQINFYVSFARGQLPRLQRKTSVMLDVHYLGCNGNLCTASAENADRSIEQLVENTRGA